MEQEFGRYRLLGLLGRGGMGQVFRAFDTATDRVVAVKVLTPQAAQDPEYQERFRREARTAASLNEPHVVPIHGFGEIDGRLYVDMRLIEGRDVGTFIAEHGGRLDPVRAVEIIEQVAAALDSAHAAGLVHRDVKPSNILVADARDFVYLIDFGIARANTDTSLTNTGVALGSMAYMAPERLRGTTDPRADVYSLTCVLYECLTGSRPFPGDSHEQQLTGHLSSPPPRPTVMVPSISTSFDAVIARGMAKDPAHRYQTAAELAAAARAALATSAALTQRVRSAPKPAKQGQRWKIAALVGGSTVALGGVAALVVSLASPQHVAEPSKPVRAPARPIQVGRTDATGNVPPLPTFVAPADLGANCKYPAASDPSPKSVTPPPSGKVSLDPPDVGVELATSAGDIGLQLTTSKTPCTVNSFTSLVRQGFFDGTNCYRLTTAATFGLLQCGDPSGDGSGGPGYEFGDEYPTNQYPSGDVALTQPVVYPRGSVAMTDPKSNGSQFFLVYADAALPPQYTVFGTVDDAGLATIDAIAKAGVQGGGDDGAPTAPVTIQSTRLD